MMAENNKTVLVVDDEELNLELIESFLDASGYISECVSGGRQALDLLAKDADKYCCILLDRMMPEMDGIEVLTEIKKRRDCERLPVIMQTAMVGKENMREGLEAGAYYYLTKPYDRKTLLSIVAAAVKAYEQYSALQSELCETAHSLKMMQQGQFRFKTIDEGRKLAVLLARACPDADNTVIGLSELLVNAVEHGNLAISYADKTKLNQAGRWLDEIEHRLQQDEYRNREVVVNFERSRNRINITIIDQGDGFNWNQYLEVSPERALNSHGRGIAMANMLSFDEIEYRGKGNEVQVTVFN